MTPPSIEASTREERQAYVREKWECMHNCELCGKCHILKGRDAETLYADYEHYYNDDNSDSQGFFICQDVAYKPEGKPYSISFRYAIFDTDDYYSRIYAYENDVLYSFSVPSLYDKGMRIYLLGHVKLFNSLSLYARIGRTIYSNKDEISSGPTLIKSNHKTDLKVEAIWKF